MGQLTNPFGVAVDGAGNVFVSDSGGNRVVVFSAAGEDEVVRTLGGQGSGAGQLNKLFGVAVDGDGNVLVADFSNGRSPQFFSFPLRPRCDRPAGERAASASGPRQRGAAARAPGRARVRPAARPR